MNVAIIGSRSFNDYNKLKEFIQKLNVQINLIASGGAIGADKLGERYSKEFNIPIKIYYPEWNTYGKSAGYIRNKLIVDDCDIVIACWDGISNGTKHSIDIARKQNKQVYVLNF